MKQTILLLVGVMFLLQLSAQNMVLNHDAESLPRGTNWTIISQGTVACTLSPTSNFVNWTMKPDGSVNYPYDHTTGASGGTIFYAGCCSYFEGPFELQQTIDVSADAVSIDAGVQPYTFTGYMQTPVNNQTDEGRYIVDYVNAANAVLGTSYSSGWQSYWGGSGTGWNFYNSTRIAPAGTRKIIIRMQARIYINRPAINVYFDDIALTKPNILPLHLLSFTANKKEDGVELKWKVNNDALYKNIIVQQSTDGIHFNNIADIPVSKMLDGYTDKSISFTQGKYFYRLLIKSNDGNIFYSPVAMASIINETNILINPNPASSIIVINGLSSNSDITCINSNGSIVLNMKAFGNTERIPVFDFPNGIYFIRINNSKNTATKKVMICHQ